MHIFLPNPPQRESEIELALQSEVRFVPMAAGVRRMMTLPAVVWAAHDYACDQGMAPEQLVQFAVRHAREAKMPFEFSYVYMVHYVACLFAET